MNTATSAASISDKYLRDRFAYAADKTDRPERNLRGLINYATV